MRLYTMDKAKRKPVLVGEVIGDTLYKTVEQSKHFMRVNNSYGIQIEAFERLVKANIKRVLIKEKDTGCTWETKMSDWINHGATANYGHGKQRFLSLKYYDAYQKPKQIAEIIAEREKEQKSLF